MDGIVTLDKHCHVVVDARGWVAEIPMIIVAGDIRSGSPRQVVTTLGDGAMQPYLHKCFYSIWDIRLMGCGAIPGQNPSQKCQIAGTLGLA